MSNDRRAPVTVTVAIEGSVDEAVAKRPIDFVGGQAGPICGMQGKSRLEKKIKDYNNAARFSPWFVLVDLGTGCAVALRNAWLPAPASLMCFRIAVYEAEAWLMADAETLADFLEAPVPRVPCDPEIPTDPKGRMVALARRSASEKIRSDMAPRSGNNRDIGPAYNSRLADYARDHWHPDVAAGRSDSLRRAIAGLRTLVANTAAPWRPPCSRRAGGSAIMPFVSGRRLGMSERVSVGDIVAAFLQACGVDTAYGVVSIHNLPMLDAIARGNALRFVTARGEAGAGHMADAHARVSGGLGALVTSTGPGAANAAGALVEARFSGTPLLHLTGQTATGNIDREQGPVHDVPQQLQMLDSVSKSAYRVRSAESALGVLVRAAAEALTPPTGPVSVEIPIDIQRTKIPRPAALDTLRLPVPPPLPPAPEALDALAETVRAARRPILWLGSGARGAGGPAARLAALGIPVVASWKGRGVLPEDHPMTLGGLNGTPEIEAFYDSLDLAVVAGSRLRGHETRDQTLRLPARRVQIDVDPAADGRSYASDLFVCGDCALALEGLADRLGGAAFDPALPADTAAARAGATAAYKKSLGAYAGWPDQLRGAMPRDAIFVRDITLNHTTWANRIFPIYGPRDSVYPTGAAIGPGLPLAIGAALGGGGRKVVAMTGDGGFWLSLAELWTLAQERAPAVIVVMNDGGYGVIKQIQDRMYDGRRHYADMPGPDIEGLARLAGLPWFKVSRADEFGAVVARALETDGPSLVEADMAAIGPFPPYFVPPPYVAAEAKGKSAG